MALRNWYDSLFGKRQSKDRSQSKSTRNRRTALRLEPLEERNLLAVGLDVSIYAPTTAYPGSRIDEMTVTVVNDSDIVDGEMETAPNVVLSDVLPVGLTFVSMTDNDTGATGTYDEDTRTCSISLGDLSWSDVPGTRNQATVVIVVDVTAAAGAELIDNAYATTPDDPTAVPPTFFTFSAPPETISIVEPGADLAISTYGPSNVYTGQDFIWTYTVTNLAEGAAIPPKPADDYVVTIELDTVLGVPDKITLPAGYTSTEVWNAGETAIVALDIQPDEGTAPLGVGESFDIKFEFDDVTTPPAPPDVSFLSSVTVASAGDPDVENNAFYVATRYETSVSTTDLTAVGVGPSEVVAGNAFSYAITVTNDGPANGEGIVLTDTVPAGTTLDTAKTDADLPAGYTLIDPDGSGNFSITMDTGGSLAVGDSVTFILSFTANSNDPEGSSIENTTAQLTWSHPSPLAELPVTVYLNSITVHADADLSVETVAVDAGGNPIHAVAPGVAATTYDYEVTFTNNGPSDANAAGVMIVDTLPADVTLGAIGAYADWDIAAVGGVVTFTPKSTVASFATGYSVTFVLPVTIDTTNPELAGKTLTNSVEITPQTGATADSKAANNTDTWDVKVTPPADLAVIKKTFAADGTTEITKVTAGTAMVYQITLTNDGEEAATDVTLTDTLPVGVAANLAAISLPTDWTVKQTGDAATGYILTFEPTSGTVASGANLAFVVPVSVAADVTGASITNTATAESSNDTISSNDTGSTITTLEIVSDVDVTKSVDKAVANPGDTLTYTITVTNSGPSVATGVLVDETLSSNVTLVSFEQTTGSGFSIADDEIDATGGTLGVGQTAVFTLVVTVNGNADGEEDATNDVTVSSNSTESDPTDNTATATTNVTVADLSLTKTSLDDDGTTEIDTVVAGEQMIYQLHLTNAGPDAATNVVITDTLPDNVSLAMTLPATIEGFAVSVDGQVVTLSAASVDADADITINLPVKVASKATQSIAENTATVASTDSTTINKVFDPDSDNNTATTDALTVTTSADVTVSKVAVASVVAGQDLVYTITVTNNGPSDATGVSVVDVLPTQYVTLASATAASGFTADTTSVAGQVTFTADSGTTVPALGSATFTIRVSTDGTLQDDQTLTNDVSISGTNDSTADNNTAQAVVTLLGGRADLAVTGKAVTSVIAGQTVTYTFTITNNGPTEARNVTISDTLPAGMAFVTAYAPGYSCPPPVGGQWTFTRNSPLAANSSEKVTITLATNANAANGSTVANTVTVSSATNDPRFSNNSVVVATKVTDLGVGLSTSALDPTKTDLVIGGRTSAADSAYVYKSGSGLLVIVNGKVYGTYSNPNGRIVIYGRGGNDVLNVASTVSTPAWIYGGDGNDIIYGGAGSDVLQGGAGTDILWGLMGRNLLIGGAGTDTVYGTSGENIMIGGTTAHDASDVALNAIMKEWTRTDLAQSKRIAHLRGDNPAVFGTGLNAPYYLNSSTVYNDAARDTLLGGSHLNWYFQSTSGTSAKRDLLYSRWSSETVTYTT